MSQVKILNPEKFEKTKQAMIAGGFSNLHILADFDGTLVYKFSDGKKRSSLISVLRDENYLTPDYPEQAKALFAKYAPMEKDESLGFEERKQAMENWWQEHFELLIESGLTKEDVKNVVQAQNLKFRRGVAEIFELTKQEQVPVVIISAGGLGEETIGMYLEQNGFDGENIAVVSNAFVWDENGQAVAVRQPVVHSLNKDETILPEPVRAKIRDRQNIILLGDGPSDARMVGGFGCDNLLKIGMLNGDVDAEKRQAFVDNFDVLIEGDGDLAFVVELLKEIKK
jgi:HAD superfamily hydrolase (TIGR01544 family)